MFVSKAGEKQPVRYQIVPEHVVHLTAADAAKRPPDFLIDELPERLKRGPVTFRLKARLAGTGDSTKDPTKPWPEDRKVVELETLTLGKAVANSAEAKSNCCSFRAGSPTELRSPTIR